MTNSEQSYTFQSYIVSKQKLNKARVLGEPIYLCKLWNCSFLGYRNYPKVPNDSQSNHNIWKGGVVFMKIIFLLLLFDWIISSTHGNERWGLTWETQYIQSTLEQTRSHTHSTCTLSTHIPLRVNTLEQCSLLSKIIKARNCCLWARFQTPRREQDFSQRSRILCERTKGISFLRCSFLL